MSRTDHAAEARDALARVRALATGGTVVSWIETEPEEEPGE